MQVACCLCIFSTIYYLFLRKHTFFIFNRIFLLVGLIGSFIFPFIKFSYKVVYTPIIITKEILEQVPPDATSSSVISVGLLILLIYFAGITFILGRNIKSYKQIYQIKQAGKSEQCEGYTLVESPKAGIAFSTLNYIFINSTKLQPREKDIILKHELNHIKQKHWIDLICGECALLLQWFNPIIWLYIHWMKENHEYLADQAVLEAGESSTIYRAVLINQQFQDPVFSFTNTFSYPNNLNRLNMIKKEKSKPWEKLRVLAILPLLGLFFTLSAQPIYVGAEDFKTSTLSKDLTINQDNPIIYIDGQKTNITDLNEIDSKTIDHMSILKGQKAIDVYGEDGKNGVILVTLKEAEGTSPLKGKIVGLKVNPDSKGISIKMNKESAKPLILIDGSVRADLDLYSIDVNTIESISVVKDESAIKDYGKKGENGVIEITLKKK